MAIGSKSKTMSCKASSSSSAGGRATSSSSKVNHSGSRVSRHGQQSTFWETLTPKSINVRKVADDAAMAVRISGEFFALNNPLGPATDASLDMTQAELHAHRAMRNKPQAFAQDDDWEMMDNILSGANLLGVSHAGGELMEVFQSMHEGELENCRATYVGLQHLILPCSLWLSFSRRQAPDLCTRTNRTERVNSSWLPQMLPLTQAYTDWSFKMGETGLEGYTPPEGSVAEGHLSA